MPFDISLIKAQNPSIDVAIDYCKKRNISIEIIDDIEKAKGDYICVTNEFTYYQPYYLHYQWVALEIKNKSKNRFTATKVVCYDEKTKEFYVGKFKNNVFYRRKSGNKGPDFVESKIFMVASKEEYGEIQEILPNDSELVKYHNFFNCLK